MPLIQVLRSRSLKDGQIRIKGRLFKGVLKYTGDPEEMLLSDLHEMVRNQTIVNKPICLEHGPDPVGRIEECHVSNDGWLHISGKVFGRKKLGALHDIIRKDLDSGKLKDLSIFFHRTRMPDGTHVNTRFVEASLTEQGRVEGSHLYSVMASANTNQSSAEIFVSRGSFIFNMSTSDLETTVTRLNTEYKAGLNMKDLPTEGAHEYLRQLEKVLEQAKKANDARFEQMRQEQEAKDHTLNRLLAQEEERQRREDEIRLKEADETFKVLSKDIPKEMHEEYGQHLRTMATDRENPKRFDLLKLAAVSNKKLTDSKNTLNQEITRLQNDYKSKTAAFDTLQSEHDTLRGQLEAGTPQAVMNSLKRKDVGVDESKVGGEKRQKQEGVHETVRLSNHLAQLAAAYPLSIPTSGKDPVQLEWQQKLSAELLGASTGVVLPFKRESFTYTSEQRNNQ